MDDGLRTYLDRLGVEYKLHRHKAVFTVDESGFLRGAIPGLHTKNLFLKDDKNNFYLVCMPGDKRLDIGALRRQLHAGKLHFGSQEELMRELRLAPGSVSVFGMIHASAAKLLLDKEVWDAEIVSFHPNINTETLELRHAGLALFYNSLECAKDTVVL